MAPPPAISWSKASIMALLRTSSGVSVTGALGGFRLPCGRPGHRCALAPLRVLAAALAFRAVCSASRRTTCSLWTGNERRACTLMKERATKAHPGTGLPYKLEKNRSKPWVVWPAVVPPTSSPART